MIGNGKVLATVAVSNMEAGKKFYGEMLGLNQAQESDGGVTYECGSGTLFVYQSPYAGTGQATVVTWEVDDVNAEVAELKEKGIAFEHYDLQFGEWQGDVMVMGTNKAAWFKDPDGNILCIGDNH